MSAYALGCTSLKLLNFASSSSFRSVTRETEEFRCAASRRHEFAGPLNVVTSATTLV